MGADNDGILHCAGLAQLLYDDTRHRRFLLPDGDINTNDILALLVDNGIQGNGRLTGLPVANDQLTLPAADGDQGIDGLEAGLQGTETDCRSSTLGAGLSIGRVWLV